MKILKDVGINLYYDICDCSNNTHTTTFHSFNGRLLIKLECEICHTKIEIPNCDVKIYMINEGKHKFSKQKTNSKRNIPDYIKLVPKSTNEI